MVELVDAWDLESHGAIRASSILVTRTKMRISGQQFTLIFYFSIYSINKFEYNVTMKILKNGLMNFLHNLKFFFVPLGTLFLGLIIGFSIALPLMRNTLQNFVTDISSLQLTLNYDAFVDSLWGSVSELDWTNVIGALTKLFSRDYLETTISNSLASLIGNYEEYITQIDLFIVGAIDEFTIQLSTIIIFIALGFAGGYFLTKYLIRREIAKRGIWKFLVVTLVDMVLSATLVSLCTWLLSLWKVSAVFSTLISYILFALISLYEAYIVRGYKKVDVKKIVNFHNSGRLIISDLAITILAWLLSSLTATLFNQLAGIVIGFTLMEIAFICISLNAESYVKDIVDGEIPLDRDYGEEIKKAIEEKRLEQKKEKAKKGRKESKNYTKIN